MNDTETDPIFSAPPSGNEISFEKSLEAEDKTEIPTASDEDLSSTILSLIEETETEQNKATWSEVFKSGGIRAVSGIPQGLMAFLEFNGAIEKGTTADFTRKVLTAEQAGDMDLAQQLVRDTLASAVPIAAEIAATRGLPLKQALARTSVVAPAGGYFSFIENPEQASAISSTRLLNSGLALFLSTTFMSAGSLLGKATSSFRGRGGELDVAGSDIFPDTSARRAGAETIEQAQERGVVLSPGAATADPALVAAELKRGGNFSPETQRFLADVIGTNAKNTQELIDDLVNTIIPEGRSGISEVVSKLYADASDDILPVEVFKKFREDPVIEQIINSTMKNPASKGAYEAYKPNSVGKVNFVLKEIQAQIDELGGTDKADYLINLKDKIQAAVKEVSENYRLALDASHRDKTATEVLNALTKAGSGEIIPSTNYAMDFVNNFSNKQVKEQMVLGIKSLSDPKQQKEALEKMNFLLNLIPKVSQMEKTLQGYLRQDASEFAKRSGQLQTAVYSAFNFLNNQNSEAFVRFILDPSKSATRLKELMPQKITNTEDVLRAFGIITGEIVGESVGSTYEVPFKAEEKTALNSADSRSKAKTYEKLLNSGRIDEFMAKNPEAYSMLKQAHTQRAVV
jgi:hypothetical protein